MVDGERQLYQGYGLQAVDKKGRLAVPGDLRGPLVENCKGERVLMIRDEAALPCMVAYDLAYSTHLKKLLEDDFKHAREKGEDVARAVEALNNFGAVNRVQFDDAGRFILPDFVIDRLQITDFVYFSGGAEVFHMWNPRKMVTDPSVPEGARARCAFEMKAKAVVA